MYKLAGSRGSNAAKKILGNKSERRIDRGRPRLRWLDEVDKMEAEYKKSKAVLNDYKRRKNAER